MKTSAFHEGERAMQATVGLESRMAQIGDHVLRDHMPDEHRDFFALLPFVVIGSLDADGTPAASILAAPPGFVTSPDDRTLRLATLPTAGDPLAETLRPGASIGILGIQPHTRRRNRANGVVTAVSKSGFTVAVRQSFGNCPKYIWPREASFAPRTPSAGTRTTTGLDADMARLITGADTFFLASSHAEAATAKDRAHGVDVSHRGGMPGFVHVDGDTLTVPDYRGNFFFNTLGNLITHPRAGLVFTDFETGDLLHVATTTEIVTTPAEVAEHEGAQRLLRLHVTRATWRPAAAALRWTPIE